MPQAINVKPDLAAEWETQSGILIAWPHQYGDWKDNLGDIEAVYIQLSKTICAYQKLFILCCDASHEQHVMRILEQDSIDKAQYQLIVCKTNDTWCRDYGPITTLIENQVLLNNFEFNAWGNKFPFELDNAVNDTIYQSGVFGSHTIKKHGFILEGGSIDCDGRGTVLTTSQCLLKRHPDLSKKEIEKYFNNLLGIDRVLWLDDGALSGDDTDCHIDNLARFINAETLVYASSSNETHPDFEALKIMEQQLKTFKQKNGDDYQLIPIPLPEVIMDDNKVLPASYINFLIINDAVLVPVFNKLQDETALVTFRQCFPGREVIGIESNALIKQSGGLHCATMNFPAGVLNV